MKALIDLQTWRTLYFEDSEGNRYRVEGECQPEVFKAKCCEKGQGFCDHLTSDFRCDLEKLTGAKFLKPTLCFLFPWKPEHIEPDCTLSLVSIGES
jgi:hypothetical protein